MRFEIVGYVQFIDFKSVDGVHDCRRGGALEPGSRAPGIQTRQGHQTMLRGVLVHVVQPRQIRFLVSKPCLTEIVPNPSAWCRIELIHPFRRFYMKHPEHSREAVSACFSFGRMADEMIM